MTTSQVLFVLGFALVMDTYHASMDLGTAVYFVLITATTIG